MNTIITPDNTSGIPLCHISVAATAIEVKLRMTPEEIREFVAKARATDEEKRRARVNAEENTRTTQAQMQPHPGDSTRQ